MKIRKFTSLVFGLTLGIAASSVGFGKVFFLITLGLVFGIVWVLLVQRDLRGRPIPIQNLSPYGVFVSLNHFPSQESAGGQNGHIHLVRDNRGRVLLILSKEQYINNGKPFRVRNGKSVDFADNTAFAKETSVASTASV